MASTLSSDQELANELKRRGWGFEAPPWLDEEGQIPSQEDADLWTPTEAESADGCCRWISDNCKLVSDSGKGIVPFRLFDYQQEVIHDLFQQRQIIILKGRQLGITELVAAYIVYRLRWPYRTAILISRGEQAAGEMIAKARIAWTNLPLAQQVPILNPRSTSTLILKNGSRVLPQAATEGAGRVFNAQYMVFDEWAHQEHQTAIFAGAAPTTSAGGQLIGLSSANGVGNEYHRQWQLAQEGKGMHPIFLGWHRRPGRDQAWYDFETRLMDDATKAQEHPSTPDEAFTLSGRPRFDQKALTDIVALSCCEPEETIPLGLTPEGRAAGHLRLWQKPSRAGRYVCGADVAEGLPKGDYSVGVVLDWHTGAEVAELHGHWSPEEFAAHLTTVCRLYGSPLLAVEKNNHGHAVLLALTSLHQYPKLYYHQEYDQQAATQLLRPGWQTSSKSKPLMIDGLSQAISERRAFRNALFVGEARTYAIGPNGDTGASGKRDDVNAPHDDRVVAYAIAEMMRKYAPPQQTVATLDDILGNQPLPAATDIDSRYGAQVTPPGQSSWGQPTQGYDIDSRY